MRVSVEYCGHGYQSTDVMKHGKKHKKSSKSRKKSKKSDRKEKKQKIKEKLKRDKALKATQKIMPLVVSKEEVKIVNQTQDTVDNDEFCGPSIGMRFIIRMIRSIEDIQLKLKSMFADLMNRAKCPETKAEYDHRQSKITRVVDPETGRIRYYGMTFSHGKHVFTLISFT